MSVILGFGTSEIDTARKILKECYEAIEKDRGRPASKAVSEVQAVYKKQDVEYGEKEASEVPERYSYFWAHESGEYFRFDFHHINRRHPLSSDGWALLKSTWILDTTSGRVFQEA